MDDSEVDKDSGEFTSDVESSERNGEASDNIIH